MKGQVCGIRTTRCSRKGADETAWSFSSIGLIFLGVGGALLATPENGPGLGTFKAVGRDASARALG
jgi:hypothetical protein